MKKLFIFSPLAIIATLTFTGFACNETNQQSLCDSTICDSIVCDTTTIDSAIIEDTVTYCDQRLSQKDYDEVATRLGVEPAAIRAVVEIEAGRANKGFWAPGKPIINFDMSIVNKFAPKLGVNLSK